MVDLEFQIEDKREKLIDCYDMHQDFFANEQVLSASMELDKLIVQYLIESMQKKEANK